MATRLLDQLSLLQKSTNSLRAPNTYANSWGDDIEVQIPQTGVSAGELWKFLRSWLGQEVKITGEVVRTPGGLLQVTARAGGQPAPAFTGSDTEFESLLTKAAESLYGSTQPYRYGIYLNRAGRQAESLAVLEQLAATGNLADRKWALAGWSLGLQEAGRFAESIDACTLAMELDPKFGLGFANCGGVYATLGQAEEGYRLTKASVDLFEGSPDLAPDIAPAFAIEMRAYVMEIEHDTLGAARVYGDAAAGDGATARGNRANAARMLAMARDLQGANRLRRGALHPPPDSTEAVVQSAFDLAASLALENWAAAMAAGDRLVDTASGHPMARVLVATNYSPMLAYARARGRS